MLKSDFIEKMTSNSNTRIPVCFCVDTSGSMEMTEKKADGEIVKRIDFISEYIRSMVADIKENDDATNSVELCVVSFGSKVRCEQEFDTIAEINNEILLKASGATSMGAAVGAAIDRIVERVDVYRR